MFSSLNADFPILELLPARTLREPAIAASRVGSCRASACRPAAGGGGGGFGGLGGGGLGGLGGGMGRIPG